MKSQTATGILASMVIGGIMGTLISYPINTIAERRSSAAWDELSNELESLAAEMEWFDRATKAQNFSSVVDIGDSALPLISRLDAKAKALRAKNPASEEAKKAETRLGDALCRAYAAQQQAELFARIRNNEPAARQLSEATDEGRRRAAAASRNPEQRRRIDAEIARFAPYHKSDSK